jgi:hypothetical protein
VSEEHRYTYDGCHSEYQQVDSETGSRGSNPRGGFRTTKRKRSYVVAESTGLCLSHFAGEPTYCCDDAKQQSYSSGNSDVAGVVCLVPRYCIEVRSDLKHADQLRNSETDGGDSANPNCHLFRFTTAPQ